MGAELLLPLGIVAATASMIVPLPPHLLDLLLTANLAFALILLVTVIYLSEPVKLSTLPGLLLLATLFRLALNISTTRLILADGDAGDVVRSFGQVVTSGNLLVGIVVFLVISLVQFLVIAKGSERVAEVAARFTLDALPGKQMSIDADVRSGLIDFQNARDKRQELQIESRFYGALDGAMKFIKGDAIAGMVIVAVNIVGGILSGLLYHGYGVAEALNQYTILTIGDGLLSQIPSLLNSLAAGMVVTRVSRGDGGTLAGDLIGQMAQASAARLVIGILALAAGVISGLPTLPFVLIGALLVFSTRISRRRKRGQPAPPTEPFKPRPPPLLQLEFGAALKPLIKSPAALGEMLEKFRRSTYNEMGLFLLVPEIQFVTALESEFVLRLRGVPIHRSPIDTSDEDKIFNSVLEILLSNVRRFAPELVDDVLTRRTLDAFERQAPELVAAVVPGTISMTMLTEILRSLLREGIPISNLDLILQAIAEAGARVQHERGLLEEVRIALRRIICGKLAQGANRLDGWILHPETDLIISAAEREKTPLDPELLATILRELPQAGSAQVLICSRASRRLLAEFCAIRNRNVHVVAHDEIVDSVQVHSLGLIGFAAREEQLAA
ncbi:MAG: flagellar biosynthesis protein FlhA [Oligoflexia bacterium]|nr:flagellar biosynthesis protein FlhA [Oligoflexia bacterium]